MIVGARAMAEVAGVSVATVARDIACGVLVPDGSVAGKNGLPTYTFKPATVESYLAYRRSLIGGPWVRRKIRHPVVATAATKSALDAAYRRGYNAGMKARQREEKVYGISNK